MRWNEQIQKEIFLVFFNISSALYLSESVASTRTVNNEECMPQLICKKNRKIEKNTVFSGIIDNRIHDTWPIFTKCKN